MNASPNFANSSTPSFVPSQVLQARDVLDDEDLAIGCECANPALQIEMWGSESGAQPLQPAC